MQLRFCFSEGFAPIQSVLSLLGELLVGSVEEVTSVVRGSAFRAISTIVKHYAIDLLTNNCTVALILVQRGVSDKDRSSRLLAGYVLVSWSEVYSSISSQALAQLVKVCANDPAGWMQIESIFFHLVRFLHTGSRNAVKETTLITLGLIGTCAPFLNYASRMWLTGSSDAHPQVLEEVVFHLVSQLGEYNPVLKSTALVQVNTSLECRGVKLTWISAD